MSKATITTTNDFYHGSAVDSLLFDKECQLLRNIREKKISEIIEIYMHVTEDSFKKPLKEK